MAKMDKTQDKRWLRADPVALVVLVEVRVVVVVVVGCSCARR